MRRAILAAFAGAALSLPAFALDVPYLSGRVVDEAHVLDAGTIASLDQKLKAHEAKTGHQVAVLVLPSLEGEVLEDFSLKVARTWALGGKGKNDGVLLLIAKDDRKLRIEVGYGLEGQLPDALAGRIIRDEITPRFRAGDYPGGVVKGVDAILGSIDGTYTPPLEAQMRFHSRGGGDIPILEKIMMSCFVFGILGVFEFVGLVAPGVGWFLYFFLIPFWSAFPMSIWGARIGLYILGAHIIGFPILKMIMGQTEWGKNLGKGFNQSRGSSYSGGSWSSGGGGWSSGGGGFSGGGGSFGGGGSSGSW
jgi:uncharacterized protein